MVEDKDYGRIERHMLDTRNLNALKVNPQRKPHDGNYDATNHGAPPWSAVPWHHFGIDLRYQSADKSAHSKEAPNPSFSVFICSSIQRFDAIILRLSQSIQNSLPEEDP
jgi:hypothetical protein